MKSVTNIKRLSRREVIFLLGGLTALAFLMLIFRIRLEGNFRYTFLVWNLFLAYVPIGFTLIYEHMRKNRLSKSVLLASWLLFFPNAPYILTDYIHLRHYFTVLDFAIISTYAILGLAAGFYSLRILCRDTQLLRRRWSIPLLFFLTSIGVYLGRFIRWNSWDIADHPLQILKDVFDLFAHPVQHSWSLVFIGLFSLVLVVSYKMFNVLVNQIHEE
ncbi:DUF1361 domain-containing protein [Parvicella tangerina]|uniref:DUF1361 domain-containing protein n=1 Tax=Parvicella tangerina TaxID=2829795 RepID=A0A916NDA5_9FLAO|nr:DUF1361 domain-containing protein [Parvicella tangerina]CAG5084994.1 hypothetical protein CRYO30217_02619 [Parvicella tangerina]